MEPSISQIKLPDPQTLKEIILEEYKKNPTGESYPQMLPVEIWSQEYTFKGYPYKLSLISEFQIYFDIFNEMNASIAVTFAGGRPLSRSRIKVEVSGKTLEIAKLVSDATHNKIPTKLLTNFQSKSYTLSDMIAEAKTQATNMIIGVMESIENLSDQYDETSYDLTRMKSNMDKIREIECQN
jgi:hypothetical protein